MERQIALISFCSQSTHGSKINIRKIKWTKEGKKNKKTKKKGG
jgi:hypothetical protein